MKCGPVLVALGVLFFISCAAPPKMNGHKLPKKSAEDLRSDFTLLRKILEANHPGLYWYTPKDSMDLYFTQALNSITDSLNEVQFRMRVAQVISKIRCGHTSVLPSKKFRQIAPRLRFPSFPLYVKAWDDSLVVMANLFPKDTVFKRGTVITGINGRTNREILDSMFQFISSDGYAFNYKNQVVSGNFPVWYKNVFGVDSSYRVDYMDPKGNHATAVLKNFAPAPDTSRKGKPSVITVPFTKPTRREIRKAKLLAKRMMVIDTASNTAIMRISTFSSGRLRTFFRRSFRKIRQDHIQNLVIDLRENGGGKVSSSILLTKYLSDRPFKVGDSVVAISRKLKYSRYMHPAWEYWFSMNFGSHKGDDGLIHYRYYEKKQFQPKQRLHFDGPVVLLQGGYSFSATTMFIGNLKGQKNVTVAGEESGGGYYGNSAMYLPTVTLPHSRIQVTLPLYRLVMNSTRPRGRGIVPDLVIPPSSQSIKRGVDPKLGAVHSYLNSMYANKPGN